MNNYWNLLRTLLRVNFGIGKLRYQLKKDPGKLFGALALGLLMALAVVPLLWLLTRILDLLHGALAQAGQSYLIVTLTLLASQLLIFLFGIFYLLSAFYLTRDREQLLALPLHPRQVLGAKFTLVLVNEYLSSWPLLLPILIYFGWLERAGLGYWLSLVPVLLLLPLLPLALAALLVVGLMRVVNLGRHKDKLIVAGSLLLMTLSILLQLKLAGFSGQGTEFLQAMTAPNGLSQKLASGFPPALWASRMLEHAGDPSGWLAALLFIGSALAVAALFLQAGQKLYYSGLIGLSEAGSAARFLGELPLGAGHHPRRAIFRREWQVMNRTPIFLLNGTLLALFVPVTFGLLLYFNAEMRQDRLFAYLHSRFSHLAILSSSFFLILCASINGTAASAFSREGGRFWISKVIPVAPGWQVAAKFMHAMLLALIGLVAGSLSLHQALRTPIAILLPAFLLALLATMAFSATGLGIDLLRPKLKWTHPQQAIKQNLNVFLNTLLQLSTMAGLAFLFGDLRRQGVDGTLILAGYGGFFLVLFLACGALLLRLAERRYHEIEG